RRRRGWRATSWAWARSSTTSTPRRGSSAWSSTRRARPAPATGRPWPSRSGPSCCAEAACVPGSATGQQPARPVPASQNVRPSPDTKEKTAMYLAIEGPNPLLGREKLDRPAFDSYLFPRAGANDGNAELILCLRIHFVPLDPAVVGPTYPDADGHRHEIQARDAASWAIYKRKVLEIANRAWNDQLWLVTPPGYAELDYPSAGGKARPAVKCSLRTLEADGPRDAHAKVNVARLKCPFYVLTASRFRSHMTLWDSGDVGRTFLHAQQIPDEEITLWSAAHEVGHLLGLHHIGEVENVGTCKLPKFLWFLWKEDDIYGNTAKAPPWVARNIMGYGSVIHDVNATPWINRMVLHTQGKTRPQDWKAMAVKIGPRVLR